MDEAKRARLDALVSLSVKAAELRDLDKHRQDISVQAARIASSWGRSDAADLVTHKLLEALEELEAVAIAEIDAMVSEVKA